MKKQIGSWTVSVGRSRGGAIIAYVESEVWSDSGSIGHDGVMRWDFPERIPQRVKDAAYRMVRQARKDPVRYGVGD